LVDMVDAMRDDPEPMVRAECDSAVTPR
jgi:hypothetical protein